MGTGSHCGSSTPPDILNDTHKHRVRVGKIHEGKIHQKLEDDVYSMPYSLAPANFCEASSAYLLQLLLESPYGIQRGCFLDSFVSSR